MDDGMQFGEVREEPPSPGERPDQNPRWAVVAWERPGEGGIPVFFDLQALQEMEGHANSDTRVELGGVLLGGQHVDTQGRLFVQVRASLPASFYENTRGSFKFTHESWEDISRERHKLPAEWKMVGWYHTHPGWGVFLSGQDLFICEHFFSKPLDIAYVIDPCRQERGVFHWSGQVERRMQASGGFYIYSSCFREEALREQLASLYKDPPMNLRRESYGPARPDVNLLDPRPWIPLLLLAILGLQGWLAVLLTWSMLRPQEDTNTNTARLAAVLDQLEATQQLELRAAELAAERQLLDRLADEWNQGPDHLASAWQRTQTELTQARSDLAAQRVRSQQLEEQHQVSQQQLASLRSANGILDMRLQQVSEELAELRKREKQPLATPAAGDVAPTAWSDRLRTGWREHWLAWSSAALLVVLVGGLLAVYRHRVGTPAEREAVFHDETVP